MVQAGAFLSAENARRLVKRLRAKGHPARLQTHSDEKGRTWHLVLLGEYATMEEAEQAAERFSRAEKTVPAVRRLSGE